MGIAEHLRTLAKTCAETVIEPEGIHCCGFAGDKGMTLPELNASALKVACANRFKANAQRDIVILGLVKLVCHNTLALIIKTCCSYWMRSAPRYLEDWLIVQTGRSKNDILIQFTQFATNVANCYNVITNC